MKSTSGKFKRSTISTLQLRSPVGGTLAIACLFLIGMAFGLELILRQPMIHRRLAYPNMGNAHYQLGEKLRLLEANQRNGGNVECIAIGSSLIDHGFDPEQFARYYQAASGRDIKCFNFALNAMPANASGAWAEILVDKYRPELLIYGTDARDYAVAEDAEETVVFFDSSWVQYRLGNFNLDGMVLEHSHLYRYAKHLKQLLIFDFKRALRKERRTTPLGYTPDFDIAIDVDATPPVDDSFQYLYMTGLLSEYQLRQENLIGLERILNLDSEETRVVLVEMPVTGGYIHYFGNSKEDYERFLFRIKEISRHYGVPFIQSTMNAPIPNDGWRDYMHLNDYGATAFSQWLGSQIGQVLGAP